MFTRVVKLTSFGGLISAGLVAKNKQSAEHTVVAGKVVEQKKPLYDKIQDQLDKVVETTKPTNHYNTGSELVLSQVDLVTASDQEWSRRAKEVNIKAEDLCWCEVNESGM